ncbi:MAG TPA: hypothetical protein VFI70_01585 [Nitrososphaeraceae archaeon]|nr:hypothetical protein [Nitrososphaeraceae archaeon]
MTLISIEEAKTRLTECNVLLKYMSFLQKNGLSDCGRGQIMGQASLLQEYLKEEQQKEQEQEKQQAITKDAEKTRTMIKATFHETAVSNISKSDLLSQVASVIDKAKVTTVEESNELAREGLSKQIRQTLPQPMSDIITSDSGVETNKQTDRSWINKIKKATDVENWRSWQ